MQSQHYTENMTIGQMAEHHKTAEWIIKKLMKEYNIPIRDDLEEEKKIPIIFKRKKAKAAKPRASRNKNAVLFHSSTETWKHWNAKCVLAKILRDQGHQIYTEIPIERAETDVLDVTDGTCYELESNPGKKTFREKLEKLNGVNYDLIVVDLRQVPDDFEGMKRYFEKRHGSPRARRVSRPS